MKRQISLLLVLTVLVSFTACAINGKPASNLPVELPVPEEPLEPIPLPEDTTEVIELSVWASYGPWGPSAEWNFVNERLPAFEAAYPDYTFSITLEKGDAIPVVDVTVLPGAFLSHHGALAVDANVEQLLQTFAGKSVSDIKAANSPVSVSAATVNGRMRAFPMSTSNSDILYYDPNVISAEQAQSFDALLDAAAAAGKKVAIPLGYADEITAFFGGAGFNVGKYCYADWNGTSPAGYTGVQVIQAVQKIAKHEAFLSLDYSATKIDDLLSGGEVAAIICSTFDAETVEQHFGAYAAAKLPTYTSNGAQIQLVSFPSFELVCIDPNAEHVAWAVLLADFLTNEESQRILYETYQAIPTNLNAAAAISASEAVKASLAQNAFDIPQSHCGYSWKISDYLDEQLILNAFPSDRRSIQAILDQLVQELYETP